MLIPTLQLLVLLIVYLSHNSFFAIFSNLLSTSAAKSRKLKPLFLRNSRSLLPNDRLMRFSLSLPLLACSSQHQTLASMDTYTSLFLDASRTALHSYCTLLALQQRLSSHYTLYAYNVHNFYNRAYH